jgi:hypothetical protein
MSCNRPSVAQGRICRLNSSRKGPINICPKEDQNDNVGILRLLAELLTTNDSNSDVIPCVHQDPRHYSVMEALPLCVP